MANRFKSVCQTACPGSDNAERSYQRRLVALPIVPDYLRERRVRHVLYRSERLDAVPWTCERFRALLRSFKEQEQLNTLQTIVLFVTHTARAEARALRDPAISGALTLQW